MPMTPSDNELGSIVKIGENAGRAGGKLGRVEVSETDALVEFVRDDGVVESINIGGLAALGAFVGGLVAGSAMAGTDDLG